MDTGTQNSYKLRGSEFQGVSLAVSQENFKDTVDTASFLI